MRRLGHRDDVADLLGAADVFVSAVALRGHRGRGDRGARARGAHRRHATSPAPAGVLVDGRNARLVPVGDADALARGDRRRPSTTQPGVPPRSAGTGRLRASASRSTAAPTAWSSSTERSSPRGAGDPRGGRVGVRRVTDGALAASGGHVRRRSGGRFTAADPCEVLRVAGPMRAAADQAVAGEGRPSEASGGTPAIDQYVAWSAGSRREAIAVHVEQVQGRAQAGLGSAALLRPSGGDVDGHQGIVGAAAVRIGSAPLEVLGEAEAELGVLAEGQRGRVAADGRRSRSGPARTCPGLNKPATSANDRTEGQRRATRRSTPSGRMARPGVKTSRAPAASSVARARPSHAGLDLVVAVEERQPATGRVRAAPRLRAADDAGVRLAHHADPGVGGRDRRRDRRGGVGGPVVDDDDLGRSAGCTPSAARADAGHGALDGAPRGRAPARRR